ncbi:hypothetical protein [Mycobacterium sp. CnD-18-1]|uniref:hypothetical protein n=1 Tax=Mycobacterium sp. CnD-18-1 TaxID=2917744 RepID=UPI001EF22B4E|nr:hypothetical protein [Mycobacterium sp. CnD-18-1]MCG7607057.1 hypothetical protein [Mycobacterium sp. CnD-18-1]
MNYQDDDLPDVFDKFPYGLCPAQVDGFTADGRPFYYRCRHSRWTIAIGEQGWGANCLSWPGSYRDRIKFSGKGDYESKDEVDALLDEHLGKGWRQATWEECRFVKTCKCGKEFKTGGSTSCGECMVKKFRGEQ